MKHHTPNYAPQSCFSLSGQGHEESLFETTQLYKLEEHQTGGRLLCLEVTLPRHASVPPHSHELEDETIYVVNGSVKFVACGLDRPITLEAGGLFYSPRGRLHGFRNVGDSAALLFVTLTPGINAQKMFAELSVLPAATRNKWDNPLTEAICSRFGVSFAGSQRTSADIKSPTPIRPRPLLL